MGQEGRLGGHKRGKKGRQERKNVVAWAGEETGRQEGILEARRAYEDQRPKKGIRLRGKEERRAIIRGKGLRLKVKGIGGSKAQRMRTKKRPLQAQCPKRPYFPFDIRGGYAATPSKPPISL